MIEKALDCLNTIYDGDDQLPDIQFYGDDYTGITCVINRMDGEEVASARGRDYQTALARALKDLLGGDEGIEARDKLHRICREHLER